MALRIIHIPGLIHAVPQLMVHMVQLLSNKPIIRIRARRQGADLYQRHMELPAPDKLTIRRRVLQVPPSRIKTPMAVQVHQRIPTDAEQLRILRIQPIIMGRQPLLLPIPTEPKQQGRVVLMEAGR